MYVVLLCYTHLYHTPSLVFVGNQASRLCNRVDAFRVLFPNLCMRERAKRVIRRAQATCAYRRPPRTSQDAHTLLRADAEGARI